MGPKAPKMQGPSREVIIIIIREKNSKTNSKIEKIQTNTERDDHRANAKLREEEVA